LSVHCNLTSHKNPGFVWSLRIKDGYFFVRNLRFVENRSSRGIFRSRMELWIKMAVEAEALLVLRETDDGKLNGRS